MRVASHDGNYRTFRMRVKPVLGGDGQVNRIVGTLQDVTEERDAAAEVRRQKQYFEALVEASPVGVPVRVDRETLTIGYIHALMGKAKRGDSAAAPCSEAPSSRRRRWS